MDTLVLGHILGKTLQKNLNFLNNTLCQGIKKAIHTKLIVHANFSCNVDGTWQLRNVLNLRLSSHFHKPGLSWIIRVLFSLSFVYCVKCSQDISLKFSWFSVNIYLFESTCAAKQRKANSHKDSFCTNFTFICKLSPTMLQCYSLVNTVNCLFVSSFYNAHLCGKWTNWVQNVEQKWRSLQN